MKITSTRNQENNEARLRGANAPKITLFDRLRGTLKGFATGGVVYEWPITIKIVVPGNARIDAWTAQIVSDVVYAQVKVALDEDFERRVSELRDDLP